MARQGKILIVDDEWSLRRVLSKALTKAGHTCVTAANGEKALALASTQHFDLVITDLRMPRMDGLTLIGNLRRANPNLPIIIATAYGDLDSARKAFRLRVTDYLVKPFDDLAEVQIAVQKALDTGGSCADSEVLVREFESRTREYERRERHLTGMLQRAKTEINGLAERSRGSNEMATRQAALTGDLIDNLTNGILVTDMSGTVVSVNEELRLQLKTPGPVGVGSSLERLPGDGTLREAIIESCEQARQGAREPVFASTSDRQGEECLYEVRSAPLAGTDGAPAGMLTVVRRSQMAPTRNGTNRSKEPDLLEKADTGPARKVSGGRTTRRGKRPDTIIEPLTRWAASVGSAISRPSRRLAR